MPSAKRFLPTGIGLSYEEISDFPGECIRPHKNDKQTILSGYFDLLYYEYREQLAVRYAAMSGMLVLAAVLFVALQEHVVATAVVLAFIGIANAIQGHRKSKRFSTCRHTVERELRRLGIGIEHEQLTDNIVESTEWGTLHEYPVSGLGVVRPVNAEKLTVWGDRVFALADDKVYR
jgi:hypothetical protein